MILETLAIIFLNSLKMLEIMRKIWKFNCYVLLDNHIHKIGFNQINHYVCLFIKYNY